jgi:hypothetical protein
MPPRAQVNVLVLHEDGAPQTLRLLRDAAHLLSPQARQRLPPLSAPRGLVRHDGLPGAASALLLATCLACSNTLLAPAGRAPAGGPGRAGAADGDGRPRRRRLGGLRERARVRQLRRGGRRGRGAGAEGQEAAGGRHAEGGARRGRRGLGGPGSGRGLGFDLGIIEKEQSAPGSQARRFTTTPPSPAGSRARQSLPAPGAAGLDVPQSATVWAACGQSELIPADPSVLASAAGRQWAKPTVSCAGFDLVLSDGSDECEPQAGPAWSHMHSRLHGLTKP